MSRARLMSLALLTGGALLAVACSDERASISSPVGRVYNARFAPVAATLPNGTVSTSSAAAPSTKKVLTIRLAEMESLSTGAYAVWLSTQLSDTAAAPTIVPARGTLVVIHTDTTINASGDPVPVVDSTVRPNTNFFSEGGSRTRIKLTVDSASLAAAGAANLDPNAYGVVFVTIEPGTPGTTPTADAPHPLWARRYSAGAPSTGTKNFSFGDFAPNPANQRVFIAAGHGMIGVWDKTLVVDDSSLTLPPKGYFYATSLTRSIPASGADTARVASIFLGPQKAPYPRRSVSLYNADVDQSIDPTVTNFPPSILAASERVRIDTIAGASLTATQPFQLYRNVNVTLEAKQGVDAPSPAIVLTAGFPDVVAKPPAQ